jgi:hypothetical protein
MLDRVEMNVMDMPLQVALIADVVLPVSTLPNSFFALADHARGPRCSGWKRAGEPALDEIPASYEIPASCEIRIVLRQGPDRMQMIRKNANRNCFERKALPCDAVGSAKQIDVTHQQIATPISQRSSEKIGATFDRRAPKRCHEPNRITWARRPLRPGDDSAVAAAFAHATSAT